MTPIKTLKRLLLREKAHKVLEETDKHIENAEQTYEKFKSLLDGEDKWFLEQSMKSKFQCHCETE